MKCKQLFSLAVVFLLLCGMCAPAVRAQDTGAIVLTSFDEPDRADAVAFAVGTSQSDLSAWFADDYGGFTGYDAQGNAYDLMTGAWSLENVDTATPGVYNVSAAPDLGDTYVLADGVSLPRQLCAVSIQTPGKPDINCCVSARGFLHFPWVLSAEQQEQLDQFTVLLRQDGGAWEQLSGGFSITSDDLQLSQRIFEDGSTYDLQVVYPGGQTGILTFQYDGELRIVDYSGGDRDGGDVNGGGQPTGTQPAPSAAQAPASSGGSSDDGRSSAASSETPAGPDSASGRSGSSAAALSSGSAESNRTSAKQQSGSSSQKTSSAVQESYSPSQTVISGLRLRDLCAGEKSVVFGAGALTVSIPSEQLLALKLADTDTLSVRLTQPEKNKVTLAVDASGSAVTELPGTVLRLSYVPRSQNAGIAVYGEDGKKIADAAFDGTVLRFTVNTAGTYTISETAAAPEKPKAVQSGAVPLLPLMSGGLLLAAGGTTLVRRKRHG